MKKHMTWLPVLLISLLLFSGTAMAGALPPQTADEVSVPAHGVPVVTNVLISGNDISMVVSGLFDTSYATIYIMTPLGQAVTTVHFTVAGGGMSCTVTLPPDATGWELDTIHVNTTSIPDLYVDYYYDAYGTLLSYNLYDTANSAWYNYGSNGRLENYRNNHMQVYYNQEGSLGWYRVETPNGSQYYNGQYQLTHETIEDPDTRTSTELYYEDGVLTKRIISDADRNRFEYDGQGILRRSTLWDKDLNITFNVYDTNGKLHLYASMKSPGYELYDAAGNLVIKQLYDESTSTYEKYENGRQVYKTVSGMLPDGRYYIDVYKNGVYKERSIQEDDGEYHYDVKGRYTGKTVYDNDMEYKTYDAAGRIKEYRVYSDQQGGVFLTYNSRRALLKLEWRDPVFYDYFTYDGKEKAWYLYDVKYDGPAPFDVAALSLAQEIIWYPNNTVCSFGPQFRDIKPDLTKLWYMFTPIDVSRDGTQTFELIGGNMYVLGQVQVTVKGDSVTVTYATVKGKYGHIYIKSEYLNFFHDLESVTTVVPEEIGEGFRFGQPISIQNDLGGDTNVLMFVRNVATFRNFVTHDIPLRRYYKNYPARVTIRDAMLELMEKDQ